MPSESLKETAKRYIMIIGAMERTPDKSELVTLEEKRIVWHNTLIERLKSEGIPFRDRDDVTRIAYRIVREVE